MLNLTMFARNASALLVVQTLAAATQQKCSSQAIPRPNLYGAEIQNLVATPVHNYAISVQQNGASPPFNTNYTDLNFCNVTVTYTHPGRCDNINVNVWLPQSGWNGRFQGTGGGGWIMGGNTGLAPAVAAGYAAAASDGGHSNTDDAAASPAHWGLESPGNVNLGVLQDFSSTGLSDLTLIGKAITASFYGTTPKYSYWVGCSTGGRQGLMLAQRYPDLYDGIVALSPAMNWDKLPISTYWSQHVANQVDYHPPPCELESIRLAAIRHCDQIDGVEDGVISDPNLCAFNATWMIGKKATACNDTNQTISRQAATIANSFWSGPVTSGGESLFYGLERDASFVSVANSNCTGNRASSCTAAPFSIGPEWLSYFVAKDADFDFVNLTNAEYISMFQSSVNEYASIIGTRWPDLSKFRAHGGKMITTHGTADQIVPYKATEAYYHHMLGLDETTTDYYRFFVAPGDGHCGLYSIGHHANETLGQLVKWVEHGEAPQTLLAVSQTGTGTAQENGTVRNLCLYPKVQRYVGGDPKMLESFECL